MFRVRDIVGHEGNTFMTPTQFYFVEALSIVTNILLYYGMGFESCIDMNHATFCVL